MTYINFISYKPSINQLSATLVKLLHPFLFEITSKGSRNPICHFGLYVFFLSSTNSCHHFPLFLNRSKQFCQIQKFLVSELDKEHYTTKIGGVQFFQIPRLIWSACLNFNTICKQYYFGLAFFSRQFQFDSSICRHSSCGCTHDSNHPLFRRTQLLSIRKGSVKII
jgi:hypothetical protein